MEVKRESKSTKACFVILGGAGDLAKRKLVPALYRLFIENLLPREFHLLGIDQSAMGLEEFKSQLESGLQLSGNTSKAASARWSEFAANMGYLQADFTKPECYAEISEQIARIGKNCETIFYYATSPSLIETITRLLSEASLLADSEMSRIVIEKPFGHDLASACALNAKLTSYVSDRQIFRIDHYLGKETVQNILALRFANSLYEPVWQRQYIDHVQITVAETLGVGHRAGYYEKAGALRDMVQNHLLQILCCIAMEPPISFDADEIRNKKLDVLKAVQPLTAQDITDSVVRAQYQGYLSEAGVDPKSVCETFVALRLWVDNWRWQGVPFYLRTGKCLNQTVAEVSLHFKPVPHLSFPKAARRGLAPNCLVIRIQPDEGISSEFLAKEPGHGLQLEKVAMNFSYADSFRNSPPEAYETLLWDVLQGDATLFMRADQVQAAWAIVNPILEAWKGSPDLPLPQYEVGSFGPKEAELLLNRDGRTWRNPQAPVGKIHP